MLRTARQKQGTQQRTKAVVLPAPAGGMDARVGVASDNLDVCLLAYNLVPSEYGLKLRSGYREWHTSIGSEVRTLIPYTGRVANHDDDRLFAVTPAGIYDATLEGDTPVLKVAFPITDPNTDVGRGVFCHYVNGAGNDKLYFADGENGLYQYDPPTDVWAPATGITSGVGASAPIDLTKVVHVMNHKLRMWLVEKESNKAWYLPILSTTGEATEFFFASKFQRGGHLVGLFNWTVDGGAGRDDHLVAVGRGGDVIPFTGDDPSSADGSTGWQNTGTFFVGEIPRGQRVASEYGGDLFILSSVGVVAMRDLVGGIAANSAAEGGIGLKIARLLRDDLVALKEEPAWDIDVVPQDGSMIISIPQRVNGQYIQYVYNIAAKGWGIWRDVPMLSSASWQGRLMVGTEDGRVLSMDTGRDAVTLDGSSSRTIKWTVLSSYTALGEPGVFKRVAFIRPNWNARVPPTYASIAYYDFEIIEPAAPISGDNSFISFWDAALWDDGVWMSTIGSPTYQLQGTEGMGRMVAVAMVGDGQDEVTLAGWDVLWNTGGLL